MQLTRYTFFLMECYPSVTRPGTHESMSSYLRVWEDRDIVAAYNRLKEERHMDSPFLKGKVHLVLVIDSQGNKGIYPVLEEDVHEIDRDGMDPKLRLDFDADDMVRDGGREVPHYICASRNRQTQQQPAIN